MKHYFKLTILIIVFIITLSNVIAPNGDDAPPGETTNIKPQNNVYDVIQQPNGRISEVNPSQSVRTPNDGTWSDIEADNLEFENGEFISGTFVSSKDGNVIKIKDKTFTLNKGDSITKNRDGSFEIKRAQRIETTSVGQRVTVTAASNGRIDSQGNYRFDKVEDLSHGNFRVINGVNVEFNNGVLTASQAETFLQENTIASNVNNLKAKTEKFSVGEASKVVSGCNSFDNVKNSEFEVKGDDVKVTTGSNVTLNITDCSYREAQFESKGNGSSVTIKKDNYEISKGKLKCGSKDAIDADNSADVQVGSDCFTCLTITPPGTYFYTDFDIRKDFNINIPKESSTYKLCLRKNQLQQFKDNNGLVDFVDKKIELNGVVNYLRYPLKNNQIASLLSDFVYKGLKNVKTLLTYDNDLLFLRNIGIKNILENKQQITVTKPNNYYTIKEIELEDGKIHRVIELKAITKNQLTQDINYNYESDSLNPKIIISNNILVQDNGKNRITILPLEHSKIGSFLECRNC